jgi:beta-lactamase superfamily II metal-dependent hydrolase
MIDYGSSPCNDEFEVTIFGPGFGEAVSVHLGEQNWLLVDSCIDPESKEPASQTYLKRIGIDASNVKSILASHWHDDHVRGISKLAYSYPDAEFLISSVFNDHEAASFLAAYGGAIAPGQAGGAKELYEVIRQRESVFFVHQRSNILELELTNRQIRVNAFSPVQSAIAQAVAHMSKYLPTNNGGTPINHAPELKPNFEAVAIHIDLGDNVNSILLGSDLEDHATNGWSMVVNDSWCKKKLPANIYKVAHHGSHTGDSPAIWTTLLKPKPLALMTPFNLGRHRLPTEEDKARIKSQTPNLYISSGATRKPDMDSANLKRLGDICKNINKVNSGFGAVRLRKKFSDSDWSVECFGHARML